MRVHAFRKDISPKINVIVRLEIELAYPNVVVQHVNRYTTGTRSFWYLMRMIDIINCSPDQSKKKKKTQKTIIKQLHKNINISE